jgi:lipid II:glycine glycyltransferase (peptidoglycan interpeptide bridge formation enzyme)
MTVDYRMMSDEEQWDAFVRENGGCFLQSWGWSRFQEAAGRRAWRVSIGGEGGSPVAQFLMVMHRMPLGFRFGYVPRGPVVRRGGEGQVDFGVFASAFRQALDREGCVFGRVDLPWTASGGPVGPAEVGDFGFVKVKSVQPADTAIVDLDRDEPEILAAMHPKTRYNIGLAERHGVVVREADVHNAHLFRHEVELFWNLLGETSARDNFHTHERDYYETMLDYLSPRKRGALRARLWFADYGGRAASAAITVEFGDTVTYLHGASASDLRQHMAPQLLHWRLIQDASRRGFKHYDFWGVAPSDEPEHPWAGITRFKMGFGPRREHYLGSWELPISDFWYRLYRYAKRFRNI